MTSTFPIYWHLRYTRLCTSINKNLYEPQAIQVLNYLWFITKVQVQVSVTQKVHSWNWVTVSGVFTGSGQVWSPSKLYCGLYRPGFHVSTKQCRRYLTYADSVAFPTRTGSVVTQSEMYSLLDARSRPGYYCGGPMIQSLPQGTLRLMSFSVHKYTARVSADLVRPVASPARPSDPTSGPRFATAFVLSRWCRDDAVDSAPSRAAAAFSHQNRWKVCNDAGMSIYWRVWQKGVHLWYCWRCTQLCVIFMCSKYVDLLLSPHR